MHDVAYVIGANDVTTAEEEEILADQRCDAKKTS
jgi:hypothetical protein